MPNPLGLPQGIASAPYVCSLRCPCRKELSELPKASPQDQLSHQQRFFVDCLRQIEQLQGGIEGQVTQLAATERRLGDDELCQELLRQGRALRQRRAPEALEGLRREFLKGTDFGKLQRRGVELLKEQRLEVVVSHGVFMGLHGVFILFFMGLPCFALVFHAFHGVFMGFAMVFVDLSQAHVDVRRCLLCDFKELVSKEVLASKIA